MRLLAVNLNYLGDALFTTPALALLKARFPEAQLDVLAGERGAAVLHGDPNIHRILIRPPHGGVGRASALARTLREGRYDAVFLFQSTLSNATLAWAARVPVRVGFAQEGCTPFLTHALPSRTAGEHVVDAYLRVAAAWDGDGVGQPATPSPLSVTLSNKDRAFADDFFRDHELVPPVVGLVIGATRPQKRWPEEYFARLADKLWRIGGMSSVLLGGPEEAEAARRIAALAESPLVSAVGQTTEKQLAALEARLGVVVSGDSGPLHIATAMGTPVVALFGSTDPADTGPWVPHFPQGGDRAIVLYDALACAPCRKNPTCDGRFDCLRALTPERVYDAVCGLLETPTRRTLLHIAPTIPAAPPSNTHRPRLRHPVRSVLLLTKHRFMGDAIVAVPLLRAARRAYPDARITLLTGDNAATVLENCPYPDQILAHDRKAAARTPAGSAHLSALLLRQMADLFWHDRPDLCLVADRSFRAAVAAVMAGGRIRAGFDSEGRKCLLTDPIVYDLERHEADCCLDILRAVRPEAPGEALYDPRPELWLTDAERERGREILRAAGAHFDGGPLVGIQPGASHNYKQWRPEGFASVAQSVAETTGATIVLLGAGASEADAAHRMCVALPPTVPVLDLTNQTKLRETMGVLTHLSLFVGNDTGVNHIAAAVGTPTVGLFGPTPAHKWGNRGPCDRVLVAPNGVMELLAVEEVRGAALSLLHLAPPADLVRGIKR